VKTGGGGANVVSESGGFEIARGQLQEEAPRRGKEDQKVQEAEEKKTTDQNRPTHSRAPRHTLTREPPRGKPKKAEGLPTSIPHQQKTVHVEALRKNRAT